MAWSSPRNRALHLGRREAQHAEVQAGRWAGASPVRSLSADAIRAYEAELLARDVPWQPTEPENLVRVVDVEPVLCGPRNQIIAPDEAQEIPVTNESARTLLRLADELDEKAADIRALANHLRADIGVPIEVRVRKPRASVRSLVLGVISRPRGGDTVSVAALAKRLPLIPRGTIATHARALLQQGKIERVGRTMYRAVPK